jgi:hypothetical protein
MTIKTNNVPRDLIYWCELTSKEQKEFDYLEDKSGEQFFRYKGNVYHLGEFQHTEHLPFQGWNGYASDSYFSGVLIKLVSDYEQVIVATYYS